MARPVRSKLHLIVAVLALALLAAAPALAGNGGFGPVPAESENAQQISTTYWIITGFVAFVFVLVEGLLVVFTIRYRRRKRARDEDGAQIHGANRLETMWTLGPVVVLAVIATVVLVKLPSIQDVPASATGDPDLVIEVEGRQYYWQYRYPSGVVAVERMVVPVDAVVELHVTAPEWDVIHSWWIPSLGGKFDAIPGQTQTTWFQAKNPGLYSGQCAELCGLQHTDMLAQVEVVPEAAYAEWITERERTGGEAQPLGFETYEGACAGCHGIGGEGDEAANAPALDGNPIVADTAALEAVVREGRNLMPPVGKGWSNEQFDALQSYLEGRFGNGG
jgi:cytochrome c oxidase subunit 2